MSVIGPLSNTSRRASQFSVYRQAFLSLHCIEYIASHERLQLRGRGPNANRAVYLVHARNIRIWLGKGAFLVVIH